MIKLFKLFFCFTTISLMGLFWCREKTDMTVLSIGRYLRVVRVYLRPTRQGDPFVPRSIVSIGAAISAVLSVCRFSQIANCIVMPIAVFVIESFLWILSISVQPRQFMRGVASTFNNYSNIFFMFMARDRTYRKCSDFVFRNFFISKYAGFKIVVKKLFQLFLSNTVHFSHTFSSSYLSEFCQ